MIPARSDKQPGSGHIFSRGTAGGTLRCLVRRPFKGCVAYEWQVGPWVIQWFHSGTRRGLNVWRDPFWRA